jgi:hypothetical protein
MEPSRLWTAPRPRLRRAMKSMLVLAPLLAVAGCCHTPAEPPPEKFVKIPTARARAGFEKVRKNLGGDQDVDPAASEMGKAMIAALKARPGDQKAYPGLVDEFVSRLRCRQKGCYAELKAATAERAVQISEFVTSTASPLSAWSGWRYVSGLYVEDAKGAAAVNYSDDQRRMAVVVLNGKAWESKR